MDQRDEQQNGGTTAHDGLVTDASDGQHVSVPNGAGPAPAASSASSASSAASEGNARQPGQPLAPGTRVGAYVITRVLRTLPDETVYLAESVPQEEVFDSPTEAAPLPVCVELIERAPGAFESVRPLAAVALRHPRLLAPVVVFSREGRDYLVMEALVADDEPARSIAEGERLTPAATLTAGAGLADALNFLHRNGVAHLHVSPEVIFIQHGRAHLGGMESAEYVGAADEVNASLFARDANFLARTLGVLAAPLGDDVPSEAVRQIAAVGEAGGFTSPDQVAAACASGLQAAPVLPGVSAESVSGPITLEVGSATSVGLVRSENQDASAIAVFEIGDDTSKGAPLSIFLVADGMGGEAHGELASRIAARFVVAEMARHYTLPLVALPAMRAVDDDPELTLEEPPADRLGRALARAVDTANRQIRALARKLGQTTGTTLTAVATLGSRAALAHVGDSRAYLLRGDTFVQLTEDHSVLARLQAIDHPLLSDPDVFVPRNMLYRSLGQEDDANPDLLDFALAPGDRLLLCSDGLWDDLDPADIGAALAAGGTPHACARRLVAMANDAGGSDNSTAVVAFVQEVPGESDAARDERDTQPLSSLLASRSAPEVERDERPPDGTEPGHQQPDGADVDALGETGGHLGGGADESPNESLAEEL